MLGVGLALVAALAWAFGAVLARLALEHLRPTTGTIISLIVGTAVAMAAALALHRDAIAGLTISVLLWIALYGALNFPLGRLLNYSSVRLIGVSRATPIFAAAPFVAMILAVLILGEHLTVPTALGALAVMGGVALIVSER